MINFDNARVRRPSEHDNLLDKLVKEDKIFQTLKNGLVFAASVGFKKQMRIPFEKTSEPIKISIFDKEQDIPFILSLALAESNDISMMQANKFSEAILIFEEYANGGLSYISSFYDPATSLQSLEQLITDNSEELDVSNMLNDW